MSRRHSAEKRKIIPDAKYSSILVSKFMNCLMLDGKKSLAEKLFYAAIDKASEDLKKEQTVVLEEAIEMVKPQLEVRSRRVGGATYQVPCEVRRDRAQALSIRWLIEAARKRSENTMRDRLAGELKDACNDRGGAAKKKADTHKMAEANKAFIHFRW